ncbi:MULTISPECIES: hypothetical protein [Haloferacaceae]|uniref:Uncharacterized protein n=1 Tax=Halorubrum glutamatedens TaxID=2707018 RepID=A0ABD5QNA2_9EURY|nr:hypothetical protein [Halobellus captivus]
MPEKGEDGDEGDENDRGSSSSSTSPRSTLQAINQMQGLRKSLIATQNLQETLASINRMQREVAEPVRQMEQTAEELTDTVRGVEQMRENVVEPIRELQRTVDATTQPFADLQQTVSAIQSARAFTQAYNQQWEAIRETLEELREGIRIAVEEQLRLEMPWDYESIEPDPAAKAAAENWVSQFLEEFEEVDDEYFERLTSRVEDGLDDFQDEPDRPYAAIHIFISMQDALLWWLCYQDDDITTEETNEIDLPKYGTEEKQTALRDHYQAYFGVEEGDPARISDFKWDCFWAHRHAIMHGDLYATYDMNIATTALLFFALTAHSVLHVIEEYDEAGEDIPSIMDEIEQTEQDIESEDVDPAEALGTFAALQSTDDD